MICLLAFLLANGYGKQILNELCLVKRGRFELIQHSFKKIVTQGFNLSRCYPALPSSRIIGGFLWL